MTSEPLHDRLDALSAALDGGVDLGAVLAVLVDDLMHSTPSFLGLQLTLPGPDGHPVVLSTIDAARADAVRASLSLPLDRMGVPALGGTVVFYASTAGAFVDLATTTRQEYGLDGAVVLDGHLRPAVDAVPGVTGLAALGAVNQAIGFLIHHGHTPDEARALIDARVAATGETPEQAARALIEAPPPV